MGGGGSSFGFGNYYNSANTGGFGGGDAFGSNLFGR